MAQKTADATQSTEGRHGRGWIYLATTAIALSVFAIAIIIGNMAAGAPREADENTWAHLFQLAMAAQVPLLLLFLATADWRQTRRVVVILGAQIAAIAAAFATLAWSGY